MVRKRSGFTIIELVVFIGIFTISVIAFITILVAVTRVQTQQLSSTEVNQQSQYLLQQVQYYTQNAGVIDIPQDTATTTLRLRMGSTAIDPTVFTLSGGVVYIQQGTSSQIALTSNKVTVSNLSFVRRSNAPSHDSVSVSFTVSYNTSNIQQAFSQFLQTSVARVSAATFDSNLVPSSTATYSLGTSGAVWTSINGIIYFSSGNVGVNISSPHAALQVDAGDVYVDTVGKGIILRDPSSVCWRVTATTTGSLVTASTSCP